MSSVIIIIAGVAIVVYTIGSQIIGTAIRAKRLIVLPGIVTLIGVVNLSAKSVHLSGTDAALIAVGSLIAACTGVALGSLMRLEERDGWLWGQLPKRGLWLWAAFFLSRGILIGVASGVHAHVAGGTHAELLILGINRLGQAAVVGVRAYLSEIPFAPERDGSRPFGNLFGAGAGAGAGAGVGSSSGGGVDTVDPLGTGPVAPPPARQPAAPGDQPSPIYGSPAGRRIGGILGGGAGSPLGSRRSARRARRGRR